jgi:hypothetical protein
MRALPRLRSWRLLRYRLCVTGVGIVYLLVALEIPLPVFAHKETGQLFPCQDHPCGCQTAEQCWRGCCCFTAEERWAWARDHHIEPPAYAEKPASNGWNTVKLRDRASQKCTSASCCSAQTQRTSCCQSSAGRSEQASCSTQNRVRWATTLNAWRCRGYSTVWVSAGAVLPLLPVVAWNPDWTPPARLALFSRHADRVPVIPPDPPPRLSL